MSVRNQLTVLTAAICAIWSTVATAQAPPASLFDAIRKGQIDVVRDFLSKGGDANAPIPNAPILNATPLRVAVVGAREDIALMLLDAGADFERSGVELGSPAAHGLTRVVERLAEENPSLSLDELGLANATTFGYFDVAKKLLDQPGANRPDWRPGSQRLVVDALGAHDDVARLLLDRGAPATAAILHSAARSSSPGMVRHVLALGARDAPQRDNASRPGPFDGFTAVDFARWSYNNGRPRQKELAQLKLGELVRGGAAPGGARDPKVAMAVDADIALGRIAVVNDKLTTAAKYGLFDDVQAILRQGAVKDAAVLRAATVEALLSDADDVARLLLDAGADPSGGPLHFAAQGSSPGMVRHLLALGADPNELLNGYTPAHYWWRQDPSKPEVGRQSGGDHLVLQELIAAGADVCWLVPHMDELDFGASILWNSASHCWPEQGN